MDDKFLERLRADAAPLRYQPDEFTLARIRARIQERIAPRPSVAQLLAAWFRPLAVTLAAVAIAAVVGLATVDTNSNDDAFGEQSAEIVMAGESYGGSE